MKCDGVSATLISTDEGLSPKRLDFISFLGHLCQFNKNFVSKQEYILYIQSKSQDSFVKQPLLISLDLHSNDKSSFQSNLMKL